MSTPTNSISLRSSALFPNSEVEVSAGISPQPKKEILERANEVRSEISESQRKCSVKPIKGLSRRQFLLAGELVQLTVMAYEINHNFLEMYLGKTTELNIEQFLLATQDFLENPSANKLDKLNSFIESTYRTNFGRDNRQHIQHIESFVQKYEKLLRDEMNVYPIFNEKIYQGVVAVSSQKEIYICFRGTKYASEWAANLDSQQVLIRQDLPNFHGGAHCGFLNLFRPVRESTLSQLKATLNVSNDSDLYNVLGTQYEDVIVSGHSLGGVMATFLATYLVGESLHKDSVENLARRVAIVRYGTPNIFDHNAADQISKSLCQGRVIDCTISEDWIPILPPHVLGFSRLQGTSFRAPANDESLGFGEMHSLGTHLSLSFEHQLPGDVSHIESMSSSNYNGSDFFDQKDLPESDLPRFKDIDSSSVWLKEFNTWNFEDKVALCKQVSDFFDWTEPEWSANFKKRDFESRFLKYLIEIGKCDEAIELLNHVPRIKQFFSMEHLGSLFVACCETNNPSMIRRLEDAFYRHRFSGYGELFGWESYRATGHGFWDSRTGDKVQKEMAYAAGKWNSPSCYKSLRASSSDSSGIKLSLELNYFKGVYESGEESRIFQVIDSLAYGQITLRKFIKESNIIEHNLFRKIVEKAIPSEKLMDEDALSFLGYLPIEKLDFYKEYIKDQCVDPDIARKFFNTYLKFKNWSSLYWLLKDVLPGSFRYPEEEFSEICMSSETPLLIDLVYDRLSPNAKDREGKKVFIDCCKNGKKAIAVQLFQKSDFTLYMHNEGFRLDVINAFRKCIEKNQHETAVWMHSKFQFHISSVDPESPWTNAWFKNAQKENSKTFKWFCDEFQHRPGDKSYTYPRVTNCSIL